MLRYCSDSNKARAKKKQKVLARQQALDNGTQRRIIHGTVNAGSGSSSFMSYTGATVNPPPQHNFSGNFSGAVINTACGSTPAPARSPAPANRCAGKLSRFPFLSTEIRTCRASLLSRFSNLPHAIKSWCANNVHKRQRVLQEVFTKNIIINMFQ